MIKLAAYAKLNLALDITGKRQDGYHDLDMIMQSISLHDTVTIRPSDTIRVKMDEAYVEQTSNTAYRAAKAFCDHAGFNGADIAIEKRIPSMAGLGGASADAAAVLIGMNTLYAANLSEQTLARLGVAIGADVPFALVGGTARAKGVGEQLSPLTLGKPLFFVLVKPHAGVPTAKAFGAYRKGAPIRMDSVQYALQKGDIALYHKYTGNALGIPALAIAPDIMQAASALMKAGAKKAMMSGSGSTMFAVFDSAREASEVAARIQGDFAHIGAYDCAPCGVTVLEENHE